MKNVAYISIGTNIGDRFNNIQCAIDSLKLVPGIKIVKVSNIYETKPVGYDNQDNFYNAACKLETELDAPMLLGGLLGIEANMGRIRKIKNGPRVIDLDLLLFNQEEISYEHITVPHPRMFERGFITAVLHEILDENSVYYAKMTPYSKDEAWLADCNNIHF